MHEKYVFILRSVAALCWVSWPDGEHHLHHHPLKVGTMSHHKVVTQPCTNARYYQVVTQPATNAM